MIKFTKNSCEYACFSNFYPCEVFYDGIKYKSSETAWQSLKTSDYEVRKTFANLSPADAKKKGRLVRLRDDWEEVKYQLMIDVCYAKFFQNKKIREILLSTDDALLVEDTTGWHDNEWGNCECKLCKNIHGKNLLGKALMAVRQKLISEYV